MAFRLPRDARLVRFPSSDGLRLEGRLTAGSRDRGVVLCPPHPLYGGSMLTPVILAVEAAFRAAGFTTLAFNFRGVGASEGTHGEGRTEVADVAGALAHLREALDGQPGLIAVAGYSFGSHVGGRAASADPGVGFYLGVAPVVARYDYGFLAGLRGRVALIAGAHDELSESDALRGSGGEPPGPAVAPRARNGPLLRRLAGRPRRRVPGRHHLGVGLIDCAATLGGGSKITRLVSNAIQRSGRLPGARRPLAGTVH